MRGTPLRVLIATVMVTGLGACTNQAVQTNADKKQGPTSKASPKASAAKPAAASAHVGSTITLAGNSGGEKIEVTLVKVSPRAVGSNQFTRPAAGKQFVTIQLRLRNVGTAAYSDSPSNGAKLIDQKSQSFAATIAETNAGPGFANGLVNLAPAATALGVVSFELPVGTTITRVQWGTNSGFGKVGEWIVP